RGTATGPARQRTPRVTRRSLRLPTALRSTGSSPLPALHAALPGELAGPRLIEQERALREPRRDVEGRHPDPDSDPGRKEILPSRQRPAIVVAVFVARFMERFAVCRHRCPEYPRALHTTRPHGVITPAGAIL